MKNSIENNRIIAKYVIGVQTLVGLYRPPNYTGSVELDYVVLIKVKETWTGEKLQLFLGCLFQAYGERTKDPALLFLQYEPGDYSIAALKVLELI